MAAHSPPFTSAAPGLGWALSKREIMEQLTPRLKGIIDSLMVQLTQANATVANQAGEIAELRDQNAKLQAELDKVPKPGE